MFLIWITLCLNLLTFIKAQNGFGQNGNNFGGFGGQGFGSGGGFGQGGFGQGFGQGGRFGQGFGGQNGGFGGNGFGQGSFGRGGFNGNGGFGGVGGFGGNGGFGGTGGFGRFNGNFGSRGIGGNGFGGGFNGNFGGNGFGNNQFAGNAGFGGNGFAGQGGFGGGGFSGAGFGGGAGFNNGGFNRGFMNRPVRSRHFKEESKYAPPAPYPTASPAQEYGLPTPSPEYGLPAVEYGAPDYLYSEPATEYGAPVLEYSIPSEGRLSSLSPSRYAQTLLNKNQLPLLQPTEFAPNINKPDDTSIASSSKDPTFTPSPVDNYITSEETKTGENNDHHPVNVNLYQPLLIPPVTYLRTIEKEPEIQPIASNHDEYDTYTVNNTPPPIANEVPENFLRYGSNAQNIWPPKFSWNYESVPEKDFNPSQLMEVKGPRFEYFTLPYDQFTPMTSPYFDYQLPPVFNFKQNPQTHTTISNILEDNNPSIKPDSLPKVITKLYPVSSSQKV